MVWQCCWLAVAAAIVFACAEVRARGRRNGLTSPLSQPYHPHSTDQMLPADIQVSTFLTARVPKTFFYWADGESALSITITPCLSEVRWAVRYRHKNDTTPAKPTEPALAEFTSRSQRTIQLTPVRGLYALQLESTESDGWAHVYASTEPGGPQALQPENLQPKIRLQNKHGRRKLTVRWNQSLVDPHKTEYCLVVSLTKHYETLCKAMEEKYGPRPPEDNNLDVHRPMKMLKQLILNDSTAEPSIHCTKSNSHYTLSELIHGQTYHLSLFAMNRQTNLSYEYGRTRTTFSNRIKARTLKDGKPYNVDLRKSDGKTVLRFKVPWRGRVPHTGMERSLLLWVMPCGGTVDVEVLHKRKLVFTRRRIDSYGKIDIKNPLPGHRYYVRVYVSDREELSRTSSVEVLATTKGLISFPVPSMPKEPQVKEYLRRCDSVTVGWLPSRERQAVHYCIFVREARRGELGGYRIPNQCGLENKLRKSTDFAIRYCQEIRRNKDKVIIQEINRLKPGKSYIIQVTASKKPKSKTLSYELLQVHTKATCEP